MPYQNELQLLRDTFKKCRLRTATVTQGEPLSDDVRQWPLGEYLLQAPFPCDLEPYTLYKTTDRWGLCYTYFQLSRTPAPTLLLVGPYLSAPLTPERLLELGEHLGISPARQKYFAEDLMGVPIVDEGSPLLMMLSTFCERIWKRPSFAIVDVDRAGPASASPINASGHTDRPDDVLANMKTMETRYAFENELIRAVSLGQLHKEEQLLTSFSAHSFEMRLPDQLRNVKNYGVIMNTLLRKAAENGGVHPMYLDRTSSELAARIEGMSEVSECFPLMREMFRIYCRLVRKHTLVHYSPVVQKAILLIDSDMSADLSLQSLADANKVSPGYLSSIFKRETGKTLSEYTREKRIQHAAHLLATTQLQIQTVALHCGMMDVQYFSKVFKRELGLTPSEYRQSLKTRERGAH